VAADVAQALDALDLLLVQAHLLQRRAHPLLQGLTLVHFSAQFEPCLTQESTLHTLRTPKHPLNTGYTTPTRTPYPIQSAQVELRKKRV
jgi:hypothetical protein